VIICQLIVHLLLIVQNKRTDKFELVTVETIVKKYTHVMKRLMSLIALLRITVYNFTYLH